MGKESYMIEAVIFDLDDTLYDYKTLDKKARAKVEEFTCRELGISTGQYQEAYQFGREETKRRLWDVGAGHNRLLYFQKALEYLGIAPIPVSIRMYEQYWGIFLREMKPFLGVRELFQYLREEQIPIMICTDLTAHIQHRKIEALGIAADIKYLVSSEEAGREKPAKEVFDLCLEKLGLPQEHIWYVGNSVEKDVKGALRAGMRTVLFCPEMDVKTVEIEEGCYVQIRDYRQLKDILADSNK